MTPLEKFLADLKLTGEVILDSFFVCDSDRNIVHFNRAFYSLFPRSVARSLKGKKCYDVLRLNICKDRCIAQQCWNEKKHVRLDEIEGQPTDTPRRFILSAIPIYDEQYRVVGALEVQRDVTDEAQMQTKYQGMSEKESHERDQLAREVRARTEELMETNRALLRVQKELLAYKKGTAP